MKNLKNAYVESVLVKLNEGLWTIQQAAARLGCSRQYLHRLRHRYLLEGSACLIHGNKGTTCQWKTDQQLSSRILNLYSTVYQGFNYTHFLEKLNEVEGIPLSYGALYRILSSAGFSSPKHQKLRKRVVIHSTRPRRSGFGELIQIDASLHPWFGSHGSKATLHGGIDDATGMVMGLHFDHQETIQRYFAMLRQILIKYGIPETFYGDNRTIFELQKQTKSTLPIERDVHVQFRRCCHQLGIELITTSNPQAKGRIERLWGTLQSRLLSELSLRHITTIVEANRYLPTFMSDFNRRFALIPELETALFVPAPTLKEINFYLAIQYQRTIDNGAGFKLFNTYYQLVDSQGDLMPLPTKTKLDVYVTYDQDKAAIYKEKLYSIVAADKLAKNSTKKPGRPKWKPGPNHPWFKSVHKTTD